MSGDGRTLPVRVPILDGEALDSWLLRLAARNDIAIHSIAPQLGLAERIQPARNFALVRGHPSNLLRQIERQAGLAAGRLDEAVLDKFNALGWKATAGSRYCTDCLATPGSPWPIRWQLPYSFACVIHQKLLTVSCPVCGNIPHSRVPPRSRAFSSHHCAHLRRNTKDICGTNLLDHPSEALAPADPRIAAQCWIDQRLDAMDSNAVRELRDLETLGTLLRRRISPDDLAYLGRDSVEAFTEYRRKSHPREWHRLHRTAAIISAALSVHAISIIDAGGPEDRFQRLVVIFRDVAGPKHRPPPVPRALSHQRIAQLSEPTQHDILTACDPHLTVTERLRSRTCMPDPGLPTPKSTTALDRGKYLPQALRPDWLIRFVPPDDHGRLAIAGAITAATLLPGNPVRSSHATGELQPWREWHNLMLCAIFTRYPDTPIAICKLAAHLDQHGSPIDYRRRRATFTDIELTAHQWKVLCRGAGTRPGADRRLFNARRHLFELLTGAALVDPRHKLAFSSSFDRHEYWNKFEYEMPTSLRTALTLHATEILHDAGIDEPLTWSPPTDCVAGLALPGRDPADIDTDELHRLVIVERRNVATVARGLGVTFDHVRYAVQQLERLPFPKLERTRPGDTPAFETFTRDFFDREYFQARKTIGTIANETGFSKWTVRQHALALGVNERPHRHRIKIDPEWLREQVLTFNRVNQDIARELGIDGDTVRRRRIELGLPARSAGAENSCRRFPDFPAAIRRAVEGHRYGWLRLHRFRQVAPHDSIKAAALAIKVDPSGLVKQIVQLERDIGWRLFQRARGDTPMRLTARGTRLLNDLEHPEVRLTLEQLAKPFRKRSGS
ncbi:TniQ family protein [Glycomyces tritici]|uniref:TniQ family protein n=1 Tax=Glycomyces tritici TaxID=2665176 RepID=A0ABT7YWL2_9ACTN|nr:TniQ family protein [Glycomyces tritici]MDN3243036.1 TniQ family protein [Glycomyces tritici]